MRIAAPGSFLVIALELVAVECKVKATPCTSPTTSSTAPVRVSAQALQLLPKGRFFAALRLQVCVASVASVGGGADLRRRRRW